MSTEERNAKRRVAYQKNKERILAQNKKWRKENPKKWAKINKENLKRWRKNNPEKVRAAGFRAYVLRRYKDGDHNCTASAEDGCRVCEVLKNE